MTSGFRYDSAENYHLTYSDAPKAGQRLTVQLAIVAFFIFFVLPAAIWLFSHDEYSGSHYRRRSISRLIFLIPIELRIPLVIIAAVMIVYGLLVYLVKRSDRRPDYLFGPDGVAHVGLFVSKSLLWDDIQSLNLINVRHKFLWKIEHRGYYVASFEPKPGHNVEVRARSKWSVILSMLQTKLISIELAAFDLPAEQFERTMLWLRPDLQITHEDRVVSRTFW